MPGDMDGTAPTGHPSHNSTRDQPDLPVLVRDVPVRGICQPTFAFGSTSCLLSASQAKQRGFCGDSLGLKQTSQWSWSWVLVPSAGYFPAKPCVGLLPPVPWV